MSPRKTVWLATSYQCTQYQQSHLSRAKTNAEMSDEEEEVDDRIGRTLFCKGLTQEVTQSILYELFLFAGPIQCVYMPQARVEPIPLGTVKDGETAPLGEAREETSLPGNAKDGETAPLGEAKEETSLPGNAKDGETAPLGEAKEETSLPGNAKDGDTAPLGEAKEETSLPGNAKDGETAPLGEAKEETSLPGNAKDGETAPLGEAKEETSPLNEAKEETSLPGNAKDGETTPLGEAKEETSLPGNAKDGETAPLNEAKEETSLLNEAKQETSLPGNAKDGETTPLGEAKEETSLLNEAKEETSPPGNAKDGETAPLGETKEEETAPLSEAKEETPLPGNAKDGETAPLGEAKEETAPLGEAKEETPLPGNAKDGETAPLGEAKKETAPLGEAKEETAPLGEAKEETAPLGEAKEETAPLGEAKELETSLPGNAKDLETAPLVETKVEETAPLGKAEEDEQQACNTHAQIISKTNSTYEKAERHHVVSSNKQSSAQSVADPSSDKADTLVESSSDGDKQDKATLASLIESSGTGLDILDCTRKVTDAVSVADDKPFSFKDKILPRYKNKEHQGYAFIIFCHAQSVAYAINIYRGTKLYGSQLSLSPALHAMYNMRMNKKISDNSNTEKDKNESRLQSTAADRKPSHLQAPNQSCNRGMVNRNINTLLSRGPSVYNDQRSMPVRHSERFSQNGSPGNMYMRPIHGAGNSHGKLCYENNSQMSQVNWRARREEDNHNVVEGNDSTSSGNVYNNERCYWRSNLSPSDADTSTPSSRGIYGNNRGTPTPQAGEELNHSSTRQQSQNKSMSDFERNSILLARVAQLDLKKQEISNRKDNPIMEDASFLSLTPPCPTQNEDLNGSCPAHKIPSLFSSIPQGSSSVKNLPKPLKIDDLGRENALTICGDEHLPILHYEIDKHPGTQHYLNDTHPDCQQESEQWDVQPSRSATILTPVYRGRLPQCAQRIVDPKPNRQSTTQHECYAYDHHPKLSDLRSYESVQCLDADNPYAHIEQRYRGGFQSPYRHPLHYQVNNFTHSPSREQFVGQFNRHGLDCDANVGPSAVYTRRFGPPSPRRDEDRDIHRTKSMPCHLGMNNRLAEACCSNACMDDPSNGQWVSPIAWKTKQQNAYQKRNDTRVSPRNVNPINNMKQGSSPRGRGSSKRNERQYTLSECFDTAFMAYQHRGRGRLNAAPISPRGKPGVSPRRKV